MNPDDLKNLHYSLDELVAVNRDLLKGQSYWRSFWGGAISAIGATIGAAIVLGSLLGILNRLSGINSLKPLTNFLVSFIERRSNGVANSGPVIEYLPASALPNNFSSATPATSSPTSTPTTIISE